MGRHRGRPGGKETGPWQYRPGGHPQHARALNSRASPPHGICPTTLPPETEKPPQWVVFLKAQLDSVEGQNPLSQRSGFFIIDRIRRHRDRTPVTAGTVLDAGDDMVR